MTTIYLDLLFLLNTGVDWLLLRASAYITRRSFSQRRLIFAACAGGFLACIRFCLVLPGWFSVLFAAAVAALLCTLAFGFSNLRELCILCALFTGISCLYAGLVTGFLRLPQAASSGLQTPDSIGYIKLPLMVFILSALSLYLLAGLLSSYPLTEKRSEPAILTIRINGSECILHALRDSGHDLRDMLTGREAAIVSWPAVRELFSPGVRTILDRTGVDPTQALSQLGQAGLSRGFGLLPSRTVHGRSLLLSCCAQEIQVDGKPVQMILALVHDTLSDTDKYQAIIGANCAL